MSNYASKPLPAGCQDAVASDTAPAVVLVASRLPDYNPTPHLVPIGLTPAYAPRRMVGPMFGGNSAGSTDPRWAALGARFGARDLDLVKVHDRMETPNRYKELGE